ncbi:secondary thiamine-phosphate synthase enzyme [Beggiatoa alba B18LD]|uniref:Secondary thiamine-phosphate synthase enzyme n=1 Tax=Beggiatoa alba B18LD TaxID=395493 RepID=I3CE65_9GAMM|nr:secondary thiamine-phosphate synthase enzyme YjbQ [Beggiatoa alba]EIJ41908.1 secondary thiamine-phosphate synthase enzyme [Beggiatoa alba B18LD]
MSIKQLTIRTHQQGLYNITAQVAQAVRESAIVDGLCTVFIQHTSASLLIQENADPDVCQDLNNWLNRLIPEGDALYTHTLEGADDMPAHIKSALTATSLGIPILNQSLALGTWQGIYLWEHRHQGSLRKLVIHIGL